MKLYHARFAQPTIGGGMLMLEDDFYLPDRKAVRAQLRKKGCWPIEIYERKPHLLEWSDVRSRDWQTQLLHSIRFQTTTASAGTALLNIIDGEQDPRRRLAFLPTRTVLKGGGSFSEALKELKLMDAPTMAIITAGERAGDLKGVLSHAIEHVEQKGAQYKAMIATLSWLSFDIISVIGAIWGMQFGFIPYLRNQGTQSANPEAVARFENALSNVTMINGGMLILTSLLLLGSVGLGLSYWFNRHKTDHFSARFLMKIPLLSSYFRNMSLQDTCKLMTRLLRGKVPLDESVRIIADSALDPTTRLYWNESQSRMMAGLDPSSALSRWPLNKAERDQITAIHSIGQLAEVYEAIAIERGRMLKTDQRRMVKLGMFLLMLLAGVTVLTTIYLLVLQNESFLNSINDMRG